MMLKIPMKFLEVKFDKSEITKHLTNTAIAVVNSSAATINDIKGLLLSETIKLLFTNLILFQNLKNVT